MKTQLALLSLFPAVLGLAQAAEGPVAWWTFDDGPAPSVWIRDGRVGGAIQLGGGAGYLKAGGMGTLSAVTIAMWIRPKVPPAGYTSLLSSDDWQYSALHRLLLREGRGQFSIKGNEPFDALICRRAAAIPSCLALALIAAAAVRAEVVLPNLFSDHMVLQRGKPVLIYGTAAPGEKVSVEFHGQSLTATADAQGNWQLKLAAMGADTTAQTMAITGSNKIILSDVLIGDVWLCSGQSNMGLGQDVAGEALLLQCLLIVSASRTLRFDFIVGDGRPSGYVAKGNKTSRKMVVSAGRELCIIRDVHHRPFNQKSSPERGAACLCE